ncbi:MAG TPA: 16S rRNA (cytosine(967)-C(5))-methyltransferase RsmB [Acidimicrobiia bacterium]|nr:16S rRNA (cytosine(967)-C(5))-methyltransferase RsmB [Acidimicrobiia bacterium]
MTSRELAFAALLRVEDGAYSNLLLPKMLRDSRLVERDRAFATDLVYGTIRRQRALDHLLGMTADRPVDALDPPTRVALRLGAYQLVRAMPPHAAVGETVAVAPRRARSYVNAVLRAVTRLGPPWPWPGGDDAGALAVRLSYPDWMVDELVAGYGRADARAVMEISNEPPPVALRVNPRRAGIEQVADELRAAGAEVTGGALVEGALLVRGIGDPARVPVVAEGRATPQDEASQAVVDILDAGSGDTVVDVAASPGGKASAIGERLGAGRVVACDVRPARIRLVTAARDRLGLERVFPLAADSRALPVRDGSADRVLVDAPCSGLGVLRRRAELRWRIRPEEVPRLAELQRELLRAAARAVRPGGVVVYSVCTLTDSETAGVDARAESELPELVAEPPPGPPWRRRGRGALLLPQDAGTDGMYVLRLRHT